MARYYKIISVKFWNKVNSELNRFGANEDIRSWQQRIYFSRKHKKYLKFWMKHHWVHENSENLIEMQCLQIEKDGKWNWEWIYSSWVFSTTVRCAYLWYIIEGKKAEFLSRCSFVSDELTAWNFLLLLRKLSIFPRNEKKCSDKNCCRFKFH